MAAKSSCVPSRLGCAMVLTTMGRVLLQCERDTTLPFRFPKLALLLASLLQFASPRQDYARVKFNHGYCVVLSVDTTASVACAVIYKKCISALAERARLASLVVLREFVASFRESVEHVVQQNRLEAEQMAEAYTLTSALNGEQDCDSYGGEGTMEMFQDFHHNFVMQLLEVAEDPLPVETLERTRGVEMVHVHGMNAESGVSLMTASQHDFLKGRGEYYAEISSHACQQLVGRAARALQLAFPVLSRSPLLQQRSDSPSQGQDLPNASIGAPILVLRLASSGSTSRSHDVAIRLFHHGVFAAIVHYTHSDTGGVFRGSKCEMLREGRLQRELASDPRGAALARLIQEAETSTGFALHIGSDGVPPVVLEQSVRVFRPWTLPLAAKRDDWRH